MTPASLRAWRRRMAYTQAEAAEALDCATRAIVYYEAGERDGSPVAIPRSIALSCAAIEAGLKPLD